MLHADSITKENGNGKRKRSLGCARDDETGKGISHISFQPIAEANLRPFGAPPSRGRRKNAVGIGLPFLAHRLRGVPLRGKEEECRFLHRHFERKREIFSVPFSHDPFAKPFRGSTASALPRYGVSRSLLSNTLRLTANEKDPSAALGMTKRRNVSSHFFSFHCEPTSVPSGRLLSEEGGRMPASPIANPFLASSSRNLPLFCGTI